MANDPLAAVLLYHEIRGQAPPGRPAKYAVETGQFEKQMAMLAERYPVAEIGSFWRGGTSRSPLSAVVTFDDGGASDYAVAFPVLAALGLPATFFINSATVGTKGYLDWAQAREMARHGMTFYSHSHDHVYMSRLPLASLRQQLSVSKKMIEDRLGTDCPFIALPYGDASQRVLDEAARAGYRSVVTSRNARAKAGTFQIPRLAVYSNSTCNGIGKLMEGGAWVHARRAIRGTLMSLPKRLVLGYRLRAGQKVTTGVEA